MAHAELPEPHGPQRVFAPLDHLQRFGRNRASVFHARRKTGGGRLVPHPQISLPRQFPDFSFVQSGFEQRSQNMVLVRGLLPRPKIAHVVGVDSVSDGVESVRLAVALEDGKQFVLAVKTAHGVVSDVRRIFQFLRFHNLDRNLALASKSQRVFEVSPSQAGRIGNHGEHLAAKHVVRHPGKKGGVHAPRISDEQSTVACKDLSQACRFLIERGRGVHHLHYPRKKFLVLSFRFSVKGAGCFLRGENRELTTPFGCRRWSAG